MCYCKDLTVTVIPSEEAEGKLRSKLGENYRSPTSEDRLDSSRSHFTTYTAHIRFSGSRVGRSKPGPSHLASLAAVDGSDDSLIFSKSPHPRRVRRGQPLPPMTTTTSRMLPRQGLLVVTVQFSDGSVLPWHSIMEVGQHLDYLILII